MQLVLLRLAVFNFVPFASVSAIGQCDKETASRLIRASLSSGGFLAQSALWALVSEPYMETACFMGRAAEFGYEVQFGPFGGHRFGWELCPSRALQQADVPIGFGVTARLGRWLVAGLSGRMNVRLWCVCLYIIYTHVYICVCMLVCLCLGICVFVFVPLRVCVFA